MGSKRLLYAVVDIETTGSFAAENGVTEVAVFVTDGKVILDEYYAMVNPQTPIPEFIEVLTGIKNEDVVDKPSFPEIAGSLFSILKDKIFVAHNVNFDFSFLSHHFKQSGFILKNKKIDTIRLARKMIPGLRGYGLDRLSRYLNISNGQRHSAAGDARATTEILHLLIQRGGKKYIDEMLAASGEGSLPPNLAEEEISKLPAGPGVYYFHDKEGKSIYVGKAKNIRRRVKSHFANNKPTRQKQEFLKNIYHISVQETATELMAAVLEDAEIKRIWPSQNVGQKHVERAYGFYTYTDAAGYKRLFIERKLRNTKPIYAFNHLSTGYSILRKMIRDFRLCPHLCFISSRKDPCRLGDYMCGGACRGEEPPEQYNLRVDRCIREFYDSLPSFAVIDRGIDPATKSCVLVEKGSFAGMGYVDDSDLPAEQMTIDDLKPVLTPYNDNAYIRSLIFRYAERHPYQILSFSGISFSR